MSEHSSRGTGWNRLRLAVLERDGWTCSYCDKDLTVETGDGTADHVMPKAAGGRDEMINLVAACRKCNGAKQDKVLLRVNWVNPRWLDAA